MTNQWIAVLTSVGLEVGRMTHEERGVHRLERAAVVAYSDAPSDAEIIRALKIADALNAAEGGTS